MVSSSKSAPSSFCRKSSIVQGGAVLASRHAGIHQSLNINIDVRDLEPGALLEPFKGSLEGAEGAVLSTVNTVQDACRDLHLEMFLESLADLLQCGALVVPVESRAGHGNGGQKAENEELHGCW